MKSLQKRISQGEVILMDGAVGPELQRRGVPMHDTNWCANALVSHPDIVREIHEDYLKSQAEIHIVNTFSASRLVLEPAGLGDQVRDLNKKAVDLFFQARDNVAPEHEIFLAGSISTFHANNIHDAIPTPAVAEANYREQAEILADAGVDFIIMEMMCDMVEALIAVQAARTVGLPVWIGFSTIMGPDDSVILRHSPDTLASALKVITAGPDSVNLIMHTLTDDTTAALQVLFDNCDGPIGAYPHTGHFKMPNWQFVGIMSPDDYADLCLKWVDMGTQIIGGCCGIGPEHITVLRQKLPSHIPA
jgi:S-methylmethionine-dependent homocysteine/selenocysteine methylase